VSKEELDQDVGLNLLQLLGGKKLGERFAPAPESYDGEVSALLGRGKGPGEV
jgi:hypothetical protein